MLVENSARLFPHVLHSQQPRDAVNVLLLDKRHTGLFRRNIMSRSSPSLRRSIFAVALLPLLSLALSACGAPTAVPKPPIDVPTPVAQAPDTPAPAPNPPATAAQPSDSNAGMAAPAADVSTWSQVTHTTGSTTYSYRYPPGWTADLSYCAPGAARTASGSQLPARCASTDILVGQKARDVGTLTGENITLSGKQAVKQIDRSPRNGQAELIYTVLVYDPSGAPLAGFSTSIGPGTDPATMNNILSMLNQIAGTFVVGR
jgi:hypothetical protein